MRLFKRISFVAILLVACFGFVSFTNAKTLATTNKIKISYPKDNKTYYRGEPISYYATITNPFSYYDCRPFVEVMNEKTLKEIQAKKYGYMSPGEKWILKGSFSSKKMKGTYDLAVLAMPTYYGIQIGGAKDILYSGVNFHVKKLKAPTKVKAKGKKKKVTIKFKSATGATKYTIYRSTKKSSGFKKVGSTSTSSYTDKKVKRHRTYYYKVKSVRNVSSKVKSSYSKITKARVK